MGGPRYVPVDDFRVAELPTIFIRKAADHPSAGCMQKKKLFPGARRYDLGLRDGGLRCQTPPRVALRCIVVAQASYFLALAMRVPPFLDPRR
jgi:hypothetical protein